MKKERSYQKECAELDIQYAVFDQIGSLFSSIIRVFIYTYGGMKIIKSQMTMGELIAFIEYTTLFINPCIRILKSNASIQKLKVSINRIYDFLEMKNSIAQNNYGIKIRNRINEIVFDNVSFSYDKKMVIENLSFKLERGKTYAFVGETGCGKSTIVNLLFRLWDTKSGNIMIDGENIKEYNLFSLRKQLSIATQNVYIKDDSIENNILMGRKKEDCAYDEICKLVGMESILSKFPKEKVIPSWYTIQVEKVPKGYQKPKNQKIKVKAVANVQKYKVELTKEAQVQTEKRVDTENFDKTTGNDHSGFSSDNTPDNENAVTAAKTGDASWMEMWIFAGLMAASSMILWFFRKKRHIR